MIMVRRDIEQQRATALIPQLQKSGVGCGKENAVWRRGKADDLTRG